MKVYPNPTLADIQNNSPDRLNDESQYGMDLRDYFAAKAMQALLSKSRPMSEFGTYGKKTERGEIEYRMECMAYSAYEVADKMMEARK